MRRQTLYRETTKAGMVWYARFYDGSGKYLCARSLGVPVEGKRERRREAEEAAKRILSELQVKEKAVSEIYFVPYLESFWRPGSDYIEEQAQVNQTPLSSMYIDNNRRNIRLHISSCPLFDNLPLSSLSRKLVRDYKLWAAKRGMSGRRINQCLQTMRVAVRYAVANGELPADPFFGAGKAYHVEKVKGVLSIKERELLIVGEIKDYYSRLAVLLGLLCGMRRGEIRGLRWGDIGDGIITIRHNWVDGDGAKNPKRKGGLIQENTRIVPLFGVIANLLNTIIKITDYASPDDFVIQSNTRKGVPVSAKYFTHAVGRELAAIGIPGAWPRYKEGKPDTYENEQKRRNLTFHSLRHTFVTLSRLAGLSNLEIQALAGHGPRMTERYSHGDQVLDVLAAKEKIEKQLVQHDG